MLIKPQSRVFGIFLIIVCLVCVACSGTHSTTDNTTTNDQASGANADSTDDQTPAVDAGTGTDAGTGGSGGTGGDAATEPPSTPTDALETFTPPAFTNLVSPVASSTLSFSSPFGPRLQASQDDRYDFHRGIDIPGALGDPIYAIASGTISAVYEEGSASYPEGGNVVIIKHTLDAPFEFQGKLVSYMYSEYLHLNSFGAEAQAYLDSGERRAVAQGLQIGTMGNSGLTDFIHLHLETRLGTSCSLEYQLANPDKTCASYGYDPHINPLTFFVDGLNADDFSIEFTSVTSTAATIQITAAPDALIVDGVSFKVFSSDGATELYSATASFDERESFDATSTTNLDNSSIDGFTVSPSAFNTSSTEYAITFSADIPASVWTGRTEVLVKAILRTTLGEVASVQQSLTL